MKIEGYNGKAINADSHGRVLTRGFVSAECADAAMKKKLYSLTSSYTTSGGDEEIIYLKNDSTTDLLVIDHIMVGTAVNAVFTIYQVTGTAGGASAITPVNMYHTATETASVIATGDASVTGLTIGSVLGKRRVIANYSDDIPVMGHIILPQNTAIAVSNSGTGACECTITFHFDSLEDE